MIYYIIILLILLIIIYCFINKYNKKIPLYIYQHWHDINNMTNDMKNTINNIKINNPEFKHFLYDNEKCRIFIKNNFNIKILNAYDNLIPESYKSDLWRYCILYIYMVVFI